MPKHKKDEPPRSPAQTTWDRIYTLMYDRGWNVTHMSEQSGISYSAFLKGRDEEQEPTGESLVKVANVLGVSVDQLLGRQELPKTSAIPVGRLSTAEAKLIQAYRHLPGLSGTINSLLRHWPNQEEKQENRK